MQAMRAVKAVVAPKKVIEPMQRSKKAVAM